MKKQLNADDIVNWWLEKYHKTNLDKVKELHPEWMDGDHSREFYDTYAVTQAQHDEWYDWVIRTLAKHRRISLKAAKRWFIWPYLNLSPTVKQ